jgi:hypothetical protein
VLHGLVCASASAPDFQLELFPAELAKQRGAQCLDHSPAGYYIRKQDPTKWLIFLEGGGLCVTPFDCLARRDSAQGSSKYWDRFKTPEGPSATSTSALNPFQNHSHVYVPYCSGDTWLGSSAQGHFLLSGMQMSGHLIIETLVEWLLNTTSFGSSSDVILSGTSAGGIGTYQHVDWLADKMTNFAKTMQHKAPRVTGFAIEGMFFPERWPVLYEAFALGSHEPAANFMTKYLAMLQKPWFSPACVQASSQGRFAESECFDVSKMLVYTKTPVFTAMNRFDALLIKDLGLCFACKAGDSPTSLNGKFTRFYGSLMNETVLDFSQRLPHLGWFIPNEFHHDENFYEFLDSKAKLIKGTSLRAAFESWYSGNPVSLIEPTCNSDGPCNFDLDSPAMTGLATLAFV